MNIWIEAIFICHFFLNNLPANGIFQMILSSLFASWCLINLDFLLLQTAYFDETINHYFMLLIFSLLHHTYLFVMKTWLLFHIFMFFLHIIYRRKFFESIKALDIKTSSLLNLVFASNTILSCLFFFFLIIDLYFLITVVIAQFFNSTAEFVMPAGIPFF